MLLCDIGNTSYHFSNNNITYKKSCLEFFPDSIKEKIYYICVNPNINESLENLDNWINVADYVNMNNYYSSMGIDRIIACEAVSNGVIVDAGSAITVDVVKEGVFEGGFIYPGLSAMKNTYKNISSALSYDFNFDLEMKKLPKNSQDAISYGYLKMFSNEVNSYKMEIILTGGDASKFLKLFAGATNNQNLIFEGMKKLIKLNNLDFLG